jgi:hypothetical protein
LSHQPPRQIPTSTASTKNNRKPMTGSANTADIATIGESLLKQFTGLSYLTFI